MKEKKEKSLNIKENLSVAWRFLKKYKFLIFLIILTVFLIQGLSLFEKFIIKALFDKSAEFISGIVTSSEFSKIIFNLLSVLIFTTILSIMLGWSREHFLINIETSTVYDVRKNYFSHIIGLDHKFFTKSKTGSIISRLGRGGRAIEEFLEIIMYHFLPFIIQFSIVMASLFYLSKSSAIIILIMVSLFFTFNLGTQKLRNKDREVANKAEDLEKAHVSDVLTNIDSVKYFGKSKWTLARYLVFSKDVKDKTKKGYHRWKRTMTVNDFILGAGLISILYFSFKSFLLGSITLGTLSFIYATFLSILGPMHSFVHSFRRLNNSLTDLSELVEYEKIDSKIKNKPNAKNIKIKKGEINFENITFSYEKRKIFENFSLDISSGKKVALVGHSGCGKSSLVKLLYRLYDVQSGRILVDRMDVRDVKQESLRSEMSIVPQECVLFDDTIFNNIRFSNPTSTKEEVMKAIKFAKLDKIIETFPQKENTIVGERGIKLSGGEKQRVSIARAILANKKILVLDEATSSLDSETEFEIQSSLKELMKGRTNIVIAHRLSTIMSSDIIVVMKKGKIVQMGKHNELIKKGGEYKKLWNLQKGGYLKD